MSVSRRNAPLNSQANNASCAYKFHDLYEPAIACPACQCRGNDSIVIPFPIRKTVSPVVTLIRSVFVFTARSLEACLFVFGFLAFYFGGYINE